MTHGSDVKQEAMEAAGGHI